MVLCYTTKRTPRYAQQVAHFPHGHHFYLSVIGVLLLHQITSFKTEYRRQSLLLLVPDFVYSSNPASLFPNHFAVALALN